MEQRDFKKIHFIGIGGIGMSALARFFLHEKKMVTGSDRAPSRITEALEVEGLQFFAQTGEGIVSDIDLIVYTEAMAEDHLEMVAARALGVPMVNYFEALGMVANEYYLIAVAGSHGKTTTTAMLIDVLEAAGLDPTGIVGSLRAKTGSNFRAGKSKYAVVEACEYKRDFLHLKPDVLVITNLEYEHVDYYKSLLDVQDAFRTLAESVPEDGFIVTDSTHSNIAPILAGVHATVVDYTKAVDVLTPMKVPGLHNRLNAAAARSAAAVVGVPEAVTSEALALFTGTWRRFEYKGEKEGMVVYDDYGHHPTEVMATIAATRELYPMLPLTIVFQPHTYTRTHELFADFVNALSKADRVILLPIYAAREENRSGVSSEKLAEALVGKGVAVEIVHDVDAAVSAIYTHAQPIPVSNTTPLIPAPAHVILTMGAGNLTTEVADNLTN